MRRVLRLSFVDGFIRDYKDMNDALDWLEVVNSIADLNPDETCRAALIKFMNNKLDEHTIIRAAGMHVPLKSAEWVEIQSRTIKSHDYKSPPYHFNGESF